MSEKTEKNGLGISAKSFIGAIVIIFVLMCLTFALTFVIPGGEYTRVTDANGTETIVTDSFQYVEGGLPLWKWILSPFLVLGADGGGAIIAVIVFLLVIGGIFTALDKSGLMHYMLDKIVYKFGNKRYTLLSLIVLFFMAMGSFIGSFEECVPLVPIVVGLSVALGWDELTGLGISVLAAGCGFAAGVCNPFTVGVAQELAGLPMFSGIWLRLISFALIYGVLLFFVNRHAKKVAKPITNIDTQQRFVDDKQMNKALVVFVSILGVGILLVLSSVLLTFLQDYTMIIVALMFLVAGISSIVVAGMSAKDLGKNFANGIVTIVPAVFMILMASSIKYTLTEGKILDTILHGAVSIANELPKEAVILFVYLIVLVMNFFISSGSAKAFLLMPLIVPLCQVFNISSQLSVMAFAFGDGFSNVLYPTNPVLLISLGVAGVSYTKWFKWSLKIQIAILAVTSCLLLFGLSIGYN
ncbi:MAG: YfcC family protein [Clostridia bacterium]|nr:YfcC family protein [Clostridia bacterium]